MNKERKEIKLIMSCQTCCKIFCSRRDKEENCSEKITYVEAGILEKVKVNKIRMDIEKDIKRCEKLTEPQNANWIGISNQIAIGHVIERIKELEEENKILEFQNKQVENYAEELKKYNKTVSDRIVEYKKNSIPVKKVKETIEKIKERMEKEDIKGNCYNVHAVIYLLERIERMLLEDK